VLDKKYLKRVGLYIGGIVLAIGIACYIGYHLWQSVTREIETLPAVPDTYSVTAEYEAWIFRDEEVLNTPSGVSGTVVPSVNDGEKVAALDSVASVYDSIAAEDLASLDSIRRQIRLLESENTASLGSDLGVGENMIALKSSVKNGDLSSAAELASRLAALTSARSSGGGSSAELISSLKEKERELISSFGAAIDFAKTAMGQSGWYYSSADGYESVFTPDAVEDISPDKLEELLKAEPSDVSSAAGRIVYNHRWYVATIMNAPDASSFSVGNVTEVNVPGITEPLSLTVESVVSGSGGRVAVVFSCGTVPEGYDVGRHLTLEFTLKEVVGFGIPKEAVRILDGTTGVYTYNGVMVKFRKIDIVAEYDNLSIAAIRDTSSEIAAPETSGTAVPEESEILGEGAGRTDYEWLSAHEFIIVKGKALYNGRVIG